MNQLTPETIQTLALHLHQARLSARETSRLTLLTLMDSKDAYSILEEGISLREKDGEKLVAYKMGLTSEAKRRQMGLHEAIFGMLTDRMALKEGRALQLQGRIHPKAEPEIAFFVDHELDARSEPLSAEQAWKAVGQVAPAIEVLDSRYLGFKYFSLPDVIADNASSSDYLIGRPTRKPAHWKELEGWQIEFGVNGKVLHRALGSEISGSPIRSLVELASLLGKRGRVVPAGCWVLLGAATPAVALEPGMKVRLEMTGPWLQSFVQLDVHG